MWRRGRVPAALAVSLAATALAACGGDDFDNEPRPAKPASVSVQMSDGGVTVSPSEFGAGIVVFTVANLGDTPTALEIDGPTVGDTEEIQPGDTAELKMETEQGDYDAVATSSAGEPFRFRVGPERESANNDLLLP